MHDTDLTREEQLNQHLACAICSLQQGNVGVALDTMSDAYQLARSLGRRDMELLAPLNEAEAVAVTDPVAAANHLRTARAQLNTDPDAAVERQGWSA